MITVVGGAEIQDESCDECRCNSVPQWKMVHMNGSYLRSGEIHPRLIYYNKSRRRIKRAVFMRDDVQHQGHSIQSKQSACDTRQDDAEDVQSWTNKHGNSYFGRLDKFWPGLSSESDSA